MLLCAEQVFEHPSRESFGLRPLSESSFRAAEHHRDYSVVPVAVASLSKDTATPEDYRLPSVLGVFASGPERSPGLAPCRYSRIVWADCQDALETWDVQAHRPAVRVFGTHPFDEFLVSFDAVIVGGGFVAVAVGFLCHSKIRRISIREPQGSRTIRWRERRDCVSLQFKVYGRAVSHLSR